MASLSGFVIGNDEFYMALYAKRVALFTPSMVTSQVGSPTPGARGLSWYCEYSLSRCVVCKSGVGWSPLFLGLVVVEWQLDLSSVAARLRGGLMLFIRVKESGRVPVPLLVPVSIIVESSLRHQQSNIPTC
ncbi:hypothetical protein Taro_046647 [Colocasia esculenta]|uniref:Uncharacterized protein n=1 Tax=Colocasia esculenta TaxID=4460 RepID=A0A843X4E7_COLES|nr:hypothetical protein [Colocasia esculenta]